MIKDCIFEVTFISFNDSISQLFLDKATNAVVAPLVMDYWSFVNFENIHQCFETFLILAHQLMFIKFLMVIKLREIQES